MTETPSIRNGLQRCENLRNSLGLNYKSAALNQLSYAGVPHTKAVFSELIKSSESNGANRSSGRRSQPDLDIGNGHAAFADCSGTTFH
jgi:hypothetical protein